MTTSEPAPPSSPVAFPPVPLHAADPDRPAECSTCAEPWPCQTVCWERMNAVLALHKETVFHYGDDSDVGCTACGVLDEWPCATVAALLPDASLPNDPAPSDVQP